MAFMTEQDKRAQLGEVLVQIEEVRSDLAHHIEKVKNLGVLLSTLGSNLMRDKPRLPQQWKGEESRFLSEVVGGDVESLLTVIDELRAKRTELEKLKQSLK